MLAHFRRCACAFFAAETEKTWRRARRPGMLWEFVSLTPLPAPAHYFPVRVEPFRMRSGLVRFGTDFGNGATDRQFFPRDDQRGRYLTEKANILARHPLRHQSNIQDASDELALSAVAEFMRSTLRLEWGQDAPQAFDLRLLGTELQEDFVVLRRLPSGKDRVVTVHVCFPSGWRPEQLVGRSFSEIHGAIPQIEEVLRSAEHFVNAMVQRGPYVRFVWTVCADDALDHHPEQGGRASWSQRTGRAFLRVERQVSVPFPGHSASLFLIRTYLTAFSSLSKSERVALASALELMPPVIRAYKHLEEAVPRAIELLLSLPE